MDAICLLAPAATLAIGVAVGILLGRAYSDDQWRNDLDSRRREVGTAQSLERAK